MSANKVMIIDLETPCLDHGKQVSLAPEGYALVGWPGRAGRSTRLHRLVYCKTHGLDLTDIAGKVVRHRCDNPRCIEPSHLLLGTRADNNRDRAMRGRSARTVPSRQRLSQDQVDTIRERYSPKRVGVYAPNGVAQLSRDYGVDTIVIYKVLRGEYNVG